MPAPANMSARVCRMPAPAKIPAAEQGTSVFVLWHVAIAAKFLRAFSPAPIRIPVVAGYAFLRARPGRFPRCNRAMPKVRPSRRVAIPNRKASRAAPGCIQKPRATGRRRGFPGRNVCARFFGKHSFFRAALKQPFPAFLQMANEQF